MECEMSVGDIVTRGVLRRIASAEGRGGGDDRVRYSGARPRCPHDPAPLF